MCYRRQIGTTYMFSKSVKTVCFGHKAEHNLLFIYANALFKGNLECIVNMSVEQRSVVTELSECLVGVAALAPAVR